VGDTIYFDLANQGGEVVEVSAAGWKVTASSPVAFIRHGNMSALPVPIQGGDLSELRHFINVTKSAASDGSDGSDGRMPLVTFSYFTKERRKRRG
jgi:hypothetical protein